MYYDSEDKFRSIFMNVFFFSMKYLTVVRISILFYDFLSFFPRWKVSTLNWLFEPLWLKLRLFWGLYSLRGAAVIIRAALLTLIWTICLLPWEAWTLWRCSLSVSKAKAVSLCFCNKSWQTTVKTCHPALLQAVYSASHEEICLLLIRRRNKHQKRAHF